MIKDLGSFTGIRISIATVKAFADSLDIPAVGITSLESLAYNIPNDGLICSLIDAKNSNVYYSIYKHEGLKYIEVEKEKASNILEVIDTISKYNEHITFVGDGAIAYESQIKESIKDFEISNSKLNTYSLGIAGYNKFLISQKSENILPEYLKRPQAELALEEKQNANKKNG